MLQLCVENMQHVANTPCQSIESALIHVPFNEEDEGIPDI